MSRKFKLLYAGIRAVIKHEGIKSLISRGFVFLSHRFFLIDNYYVSNRDLTKLRDEDEKEFLPKLDNFCVRMISTNNEADELLAEGLTFGAYELNLRDSLDKDVISICIFVENELASIHCIADNEKSKKIVDFRPLPVNFKNGDVVGGRALTIPKFRRFHLRVYSGYLLRKYYRSKKYIKAVGSFGIKNYPALTNATRFPDLKIVAKCLYIKILWFRYYKEREIGPYSVKEILEQKPEYAKYIK